MSGEKERIANEIGKLIGDRCQGSRKPGQAPTRYAYIAQGARLGALEALSRAHPTEGDEIARLKEALEKAAGWFEQYAVEHYAKAKNAPDGGEQHSREVKGRLNRERANELRDALSIRGGKSG